MKLSEITPHVAEQLLGKTIDIQHIQSGMAFQARVIDCCFDNQTGLIFEFTKHRGAAVYKNLKKRLADVTTLDLDGPGRGRPIGVDARNIFDGALFQLGATTKALVQNLASDLPTGQAS